MENRFFTRIFAREKPGVPFKWLWFTDEARWGAFHHALPMSQETALQAMTNPAFGQFDVDNFEVQKIEVVKIKYEVHQSLPFDSAAYKKQLLAKKRAAALAKLTEEERELLGL